MKQLQHPKGIFIRAPDYVSSYPVNTQNEKTSDDCTGRMSPAEGDLGAAFLMTHRAGYSKPMEKFNVFCCVSE